LCAQPSTAIEAGRQTIGDQRSEGFMLRKGIHSVCGLDQSYSDDDLKRRAEKERLGTLALPLKIEGNSSNASEGTGAERVQLQG
jgi:hypothetical protein